MRKTRREINEQARVLLSSETSKVLGFFTPMMLNPDLKREFDKSVESVASFLDKAQRELAEKIKVS